MRELTARQEAVLNFINDQRWRHQRHPTRAEIAEHFGWKSPNAAETHLRAIERKGYIRLARGAARGIYVECGEAG